MFNGKLIDVYQGLLKGMKVTIHCKFTKVNTVKPSSVCPVCMVPRALLAVMYGHIGAKPLEVFSASFSASTKDLYELLCHRGRLGG